MVPATDHACSTRPSVRTLSTGLRNPTDLRQMAKSNASIAPWPKNGLTRKPITETKPAPRHMLTGCTTIITTDPTPASEVSHPQTAFTTSRGITASLVILLAEQLWPAGRLPTVGGKVDRQGRHRPPGTPGRPRVAPWTLPHRKWLRQ